MAGLKAGLKRSVSVAIRRGDDVHGAILIVQRPADDDDLPNAWGLPAASLHENESWQDAVRRAGREKLGVELVVERELNQGHLQRATYELRMKLFQAHIVSGEAHVPQSNSSVTQYQDWKWGSAADLQPAANAGSLCSRLFLEYCDTDR